MISALAIGAAIILAAIAAGAALAHLLDHITPHPKDGDDQP